MSECSLLQNQTYYDGVPLREREKHLQKIREDRLNKIFDDFNKNMARQFDAIDAQIAGINTTLREALK